MRYGATAHADAGGVWPPKYWKLELTLENGTRMAFCDSRRFGRIRYVTDPRAHPPLSELGWDPLLSWPPLAEFQDALKKARKRTLKALLLDQGFSAGVGNWIADEALYQTRLHPEQPAGDLSDEQSAALHAAIPHICQVACDADGDSTRMPHDWLFHVRCAHVLVWWWWERAEIWRDGDGEVVLEGPFHGRRGAPLLVATSVPFFASPTMHRLSSAFTESCAVHLRHARWSKRNQTKPTIDGHVIDHITVGGRTSAYVPALQRLKGHSGGPAPNVPPSEDTGAGAGAGEPKAASKRAKREKPTKEAATRARSVAKKARATSDDDGKDRRASRSGAKTSADERAKQPASGNRESSDARPERKRAGGNSGSAPGKVSPRRPSARTARSRRV